jgi:twitching motility protein PilJ
MGLNGPFMLGNRRICLEDWNPDMTQLSDTPGLRTDSSPLWTDRPPNEKTTGVIDQPSRTERSVQWRSLQTNPVLRWFLNLPLGRKQLLAIIVCEFLPLAGTLLASSASLSRGLHTQIETQAKSEVALTQLQYNIKLNQMGFGGRGQSDNPLLIGALGAARNGSLLGDEAQERVRRILENEIKSRKIEYATLVDADAKIVAGANRNRVGELFDPGKLVSAAITQGVQVKATNIMSWQDFQAEGAPMPKGLEPQDILVRLVVTPVRDPETSLLLGALVFGDIVNGKTAITDQTLLTLGKGYSAVYMHKPDGKFIRIGSSYMDKGGSLETITRTDALPNDELLQQAIRSPKGTPVTARIQMGAENHRFTLAARTVPSQLSEQPGGQVASFESADVVLVHGTIEDDVHNLIRQGNVEKLITLLLGVSLLLLWAMLFRHTILRPLMNLEQTAQKFTEGDRSQRADIFAMDEIGHLTLTFNAMADNLEQSESDLSIEARIQEESAQRARQLNDITSQMRDSPEAPRIMGAAVRGVRQALDADRVVVYELNPDLSGVVSAESVVANYGPMLGITIHDPCFADKYAELYRRGRIHITENLDTADECYQKELVPYSIRANLVVPIILGEQLLGLFAVHQCSNPRCWTESDVGFVRQVVTQLGFALEQGTLSRQREASRQQTESLLGEQKRYSESLQMQILDLLGDVEGAAMGDLTVRADVTAGEIGTVADFFNSIIENLRQIVVQVKSSVSHVNSSVDNNEQSIRQLADDALRQADEISKALLAVERMTFSIQAVASNARQAAEVSQLAADTATAGGKAVDRTVQNILTLRETIGETAKKVKRLGESSQQISKVVFLINQIATQTNLLAINAGIEAARAGEQGQGFAVVAEEVGELATRSSTATQEIEQLVEAIQRETSEVVEAMELGTTQVVEGTKLADETKQSLERIVQVSTQIDNLVKSISDATVSQATTSETISTLMQELATIATQSSQSSFQVSDSLRQTVEVTKELQESVGAFKVK